MNLFREKYTALAIFGMGNDGHFAGLFPDKDNRSTQMSEKNYVTSSFVISQEEWRLSITRKTIKMINSKFLLISGKPKGTTLNLASKHISNLPVEFLVDDEIQVFCDKDCYVMFESG